MPMDELLGRKIPHSAPAEQAVIGSMLIDSRCIPEVLEKLKPDEFYLQLNRDIFETIYAMFAYNLAIDPVTVLDQMKVRGVYQDNCEEYLAELMRVTPTAANVMEYAQIVRDRALLRRLAETADEINNMVYEGAGEADAMLEAAERRIYQLRQGRNVGGLIPVSFVVPQVFDQLSEASASGRQIPGLSTGLADLDRVTLGLNKGELILIAARPGMGKTSIALNMALHVALNLHETVAIFSLEMSREQLVMRLLSRAALVPAQNLLTGQLSDPQWHDITDAAAALSATDIRIDDNPTLTVSDMNAACRRVQNLGLVVIDYLQLMQSAGSGHSWSNESRTQAVSDMSRMLKIMAKELNVPVICLSQLSRANEARQDKRPMLSDLRESGAIEQDADVVIGLYRDGYYNKESENPNLAEAIVLKNRKGQTGTVELLWLPEYTSFSLFEKRRDDEY
ncbi:MAG: replicative DNA helicase [Oscillospiraceae bacterium]|nr:replicative DNA helicase [Oscillospiraceae bacterium]